MNRKQEDKMQFSREKRLEKEKSIHQSCQPIMLVDGLCYTIGQSIRLSQNIYHALEKNI